jgi:hypothetical protein
VTGSDTDITLTVMAPNYGWNVAEFVFNIVTGSTDMSGEGPRVVAINHHGREYVVEQFTTTRRAKRAAVAMRKELMEMGSVAWGAAHSVPSNFLR